VDDVKEIRENTTDPDTRKLCELLDQEYKFPVEFMFIDKDLNLIDKLNANDDFGISEEHEGGQGVLTDPRDFIAYLNDTVGKAPVP